MTKILETLWDDTVHYSIAEVGRSKIDVTFDGLRGGGDNDFARFIGTSKEPLEENFYKAKITQDGHQ